jgi:hypothetical protein
MCQSQPKIHRYAASLLLGVTGRTNDSWGNYKARYAAKSGVESAVKMDKSRHSCAMHIQHDYCWPSHATRNRGMATETPGSREMRKRDLCEARQVRIEICCPRRCDSIPAMLTAGWSFDKSTDVGTWPTSEVDGLASSSRERADGQHGEYLYQPMLRCLVA